MSDQDPGNQSGNENNQGADNSGGGPDIHYSSDVGDAVNAIVAGETNAVIVGEKPKQEESDYTDYGQTEDPAVTEARKSASTRKGENIQRDDGRKADPTKTEKEGSTDEDEASRAKDQAENSNDSSKDSDSGSEKETGDEDNSGEEEREPVTFKSFDGETSYKEDQILNMSKDFKPDSLIGLNGEAATVREWEAKIEAGNTLRDHLSKMETEVYKPQQEMDKNVIISMQQALYMSVPPELTPAQLSQMTGDQVKEYQEYRNERLIANQKTASAIAQNAEMIEANGKKAFEAKREADRKGEVAKFRGMHPSLSDDASYDKVWNRMRSFAEKEGMSEDEIEFASSSVRNLILMAMNRSEDKKQVSDKLNGKRGVKRPPGKPANSRDAGGSSEHDEVQKILSNPNLTEEQKESLLFKKMVDNATVSTGF